MMPYDFPQFTPEEAQEMDRKGMAVIMHVVRHPVLYLGGFVGASVIIRFLSSWMS